MSGARARCVKKNRIHNCLHCADERLRTRALLACSVGVMKTHWPHAPLNRDEQRRDTGLLDEHRRMRTRYLPAERHEALPLPGETTITLSLKLVRGELVRG